MIEIDKTPLEELTLNGILALEDDRYNVEQMKVRVARYENRFGFSFQLVHRTLDEFGRFNNHDWIMVIVENGKVVEFSTSSNGIPVRDTNMYYFTDNHVSNRLSMDIYDIYDVSSDAWNVPLKNWKSCNLKMFKK